MSRLFWKLFFGFWAAMILTAAAATIATTQLARGWQERAVERRQELVALTEPAQAALDEGGRAGLEEWLREAVVEYGDHLYVLEGHDDLLGRPLPFPVEAFDRPDRPDRPRARRRPPFFPGPRFPRPEQFGRNAPTFERAGVAMRLLFPPDGEPYRLISDLELRPIVMFRSPAALGLRLGITLLIGGVMAFLLARYMSSPLLELRKTTERFSSGELDVRVDRKLASRQDEIGDLAREFDEMAERVGLLLTSQRRLLGDLSHELRSPLARLQVALELARRRIGDGAPDELARIELEAERLNHLIGEILALVRMETSPDKLERHSVDLGELLEGVVDDANFECKPDDREVRLTASGSPLAAMVNDELIRRAVDNVIRNAIRHTPAGSTVDVALSRNGSEARIVVRDHGPGVQPSALPHLFEAFYREDTTRASHASGSGVGLAIAKRAVEVHGGRIAAENAASDGLAVEIVLPL